MKEYEVIIKRKQQRIVDSLGKKEAAVFAKLVEDLRTSGPVQPLYPNYSALGKGKYHCHLSYHWVACWSNEKGKLEIEVYYVGSRESAPY